MGSHEIRFEDGAAYERYMGKWSRLAGDAFLDWLTPAGGARWLDVGCGSGAFTELLFERCAPESVAGIDPSEAQIAYARNRFASYPADLRQGDAMAMPFANDAFDVAVMPLVIFFLPDPAKGVGEMARVVAPGGAVTAYAWDLSGGGFPYEVLVSEIRALGYAVPQPPSPGASDLAVLQDLWTGAGLETIETTVLTVHRTFRDFDDYWTTILGAPSAGPTLRSMSGLDSARLQVQLHERLPADAEGRIAYSARAHAVKGRVPC